MNDRTEEEVEIEFGVAAFKGGYLPLVRENGRVVSIRWWAHGFGRDEALAAARQEVQYRRSRYIGDWVIKVKAIEGGAS